MANAIPVHKNVDKKADIKADTEEAAVAPTTVQGVDPVALQRIVNAAVEAAVTAERAKNDKGEAVDRIQRQDPGMAGKVKMPDGSIRNNF